LWEEVDGMRDRFVIGGVELNSRLFVGTGKYASDSLIPEIIRRSGAQVITVALRRMEFGSTDNVMNYIPEGVRIMPNTSGARNAAEAVRIARLAREAGCGDWVKIEVISDNKHLLPDGYETVKATEILAAEGFKVFPYISPDLMVAKRLAEAGAAAVMPLGAPIGTNRGLKTKELLRILIKEIELPIIVDAGIGRPSHACEAMEMGAAACLLNTAIASAGNPVLMAEAFGKAVSAGRQAYLAGLGGAQDTARASSPLTGFLYENRIEEGVNNEFLSRAFEIPRF
jgi:thiazole synthase